jgi:hypothetical protein
MLRLLKDALFQYPNTVSLFNVKYNKLDPSCNFWGEQNIFETVLLLFLILSFHNCTIMQRVSLKIVAILMSSRSVAPDRLWCSISGCRQTCPRRCTTFFIRFLHPKQISKIVLSLSTLLAFSNIFQVSFLVRNFGDEDKIISKRGHLDVH